MNRRRKATPPQCCPDPNDFPNWKPLEIIPRKCLSLCLLCSNAETRHLERLQKEFAEFFNDTMDPSEVLDDTRQMLYQLQAKVQCTIAETQQELSEKVTDTKSGKAINPTEQTPMDVDEDPQQESADHRHKWSGLAAAISSTENPTIREKSPPPHVSPLKGIKPGDRIPKSELLQSEEHSDSEFI